MVKLCTFIILFPLLAVKERRGFVKKPFPKVLETYVPYACKTKRRNPTILSLLRGESLGGEKKKDLNILACKTSRHRSGAGTALLRWGTDKADREGKVAYLEASPAGYPLYRRLGFEDMHVQDLCVTERWGAARGPGEDWGGDGAVALAGPAPEGVFRTVFMRRVPRGG